MIELTNQYGKTIRYSFFNDGLIDSAQQRADLASDFTFRCCFLWVLSSPHTWQCFKITGVPLIGPTGILLECGTWLPEQVVCGVNPIHAHALRPLLRSDFARRPRLCSRYLGTGADEGASMLDHLKKHPEAVVFAPDDVRILTTAFDEAWKAVLASEVLLRPLGQAEAARELLALRIIEIAQLGERDPQRLRDDALSYLARTNSKSTGL